MTQNEKNIEELSLKIAKLTEQFCALDGKGIDQAGFAEKLLKFLQSHQHNDDVKEAAMIWNDTLFSPVATELNAHNLSRVDIKDNDSTQLMLLTLNKKVNELNQKVEGIYELLANKSPTPLTEPKKTNSHFNDLSVTADASQQGMETITFKRIH